MSEANKRIFNSFITGHQVSFSLAVASGFWSTLVCPCTSLFVSEHWRPNMFHVEQKIMEIQQLAALFSFAAKKVNKFLFSDFCCNFKINLIWLPWVFIPANGLLQLWRAGLPSVMCGLPTAAGFSVRAWASRRAVSVVVAHGFSALAMWHSSDQDSNLCPLALQANSLAPDHQGSPLSCDFCYGLMPSSPKVICRNPNPQYDGIWSRALGTD